MPPDNSWIPSEYQAIAAVIIALILIGGAVTSFLRNLKGSAPDKSEPIVSGLSIAFGDSQRLEQIVDCMSEISQTLREIRAIYDRASERDLDRFERFMGSLSNIVGAMSGPRSPRVRRRTAAKSRSKKPKRKSAAKR
jgi:hypothetical protein